MGTAVLYCAISAILAYLLGSMNTSLIISKLKGTDIRKHGSGNAGTTNTFRTLGKWAGISVFAGDVLKGVIAVLIARCLTDIELAQYLAGIFVVLGHDYPAFFGFKGGKGIATSIAVIFMLDWRVGLVTFLTGILIMLISKYVSLGSLAGTAASIASALIFRRERDFILFILVLGSMAVYKHKENIKRLINGTEPKIGKRARN